MKYCPNCGQACSDADRYCTNCGEPLSIKNTYATRPIIDAGNVKKRSIAICVILSFITCGLYFIYWQLKLNTEINYLSGEEHAASSGVVFLLSLFTCGLYSIYWAYKMGERSDVIYGSNRSYHILFLILQICGLPLISAILMQDTINNVL